MISLRGRVWARGASVGPAACPDRRDHEPFLFVDSFTVSLVQSVTTAADRIVAIEPSGQDIDRQEETDLTHGAEKGNFSSDVT